MQRLRLIFFVKWKFVFGLVSEWMNVVHMNSEDMLKVSLFWRLLAQIHCQKNARMIKSIGSVFSHYQMRLTVLFIRISFVESFFALITHESPDPSVNRHMIIPSSNQGKDFWPVITFVLDACVFIHVKLVVSTVVYSCFTLITIEVESPGVCLHVAHEACFVIILFVTSAATIFSTHKRRPLLDIGHFAW